MDIRHLLKIGFVVVFLMFIMSFGIGLYLVEMILDKHMDAALKVSIAQNMGFLLALWNGAGILIVSAIRLLIYPRFELGCTKMSEAASRFGEGDLGHRIDYPHKNEIGRVAVQMNQMAIQLASANAEVRKQQALAESLLLNILPPEVAEELKSKGAVDPSYHEDVTILFTDFKGFTASVEEMATSEVVALLHEYFTAFDGITEHYGLEKLKTIGDSYMCAVGLTHKQSSHAVDAVLAAFEMIDVVVRRGGTRWPIRIGVHTGPVVSGVVGVRKFAFDVWGESVNFASRIESSGSPNRINVSASTYNRVKDFFACEPRGMIATKEGREYEMYFATGVNQSLSAPEAFSERYQSYFRRSLVGLPKSLVADITSA